MTLEDLAIVYDISDDSHSHPWTRGIIQDCLSVGYHCRVLTQSQEIVGYIIYSIAAAECHILNLCVARPHQRQGHARRLVQDAMDTAKRAAAESIYLEVRRSNTAAQALYEVLAFQQIAVRKDYYPDAEGKEDALVYRKDIG